MDQIRCPWNGEKLFPLFSDVLAWWRGVNFAWGAWQQRKQPSESIIRAPLASTASPWQRASKHGLPLCSAAPERYRLLAVCASKDCLDTRDSENTKHTERVSLPAMVIVTMVIVTKVMVTMALVRWSPQWPLNCIHPLCVGIFIFGGDSGSVV